MMTLLTPLRAASDPSTPTLVEASVELQRLMGRLESMQMRIEEADLEQSERLDGELWKVNLRWELYYFRIEELALEHEPLLDQVVEMNNKIDNTRQRIEAQREYWEQSALYEQLAREITEQLAQFERMERQAQQLTLSEQSAEQLEQLKAQEEILFGECSARWERASTILSNHPSIDTQEVTREVFSQITLLSSKIKEAEFKSLFDRAKDYIYGMAAVAVLLMFLSSIQAKIAAAKSLADNMKAMEKLRNGGGSEHPLM